VSTSRALHIKEGVEGMIVLQDVEVDIFTHICDEIICEMPQTACIEIIEKLREVSMRSRILWYEEFKITSQLLSDMEDIEKQLTLLFTAYALQLIAWKAAVVSSHGP
jgi:hypothetical protein